jgi:hypothetical protein
MSKKPVPQAWHPAPYTPHVTSAIKALANDPKHKFALDWIIYQLCGTYDQPYRPGEGGDRDTVFACAKQFVGQQIVKHINMPMPTNEKQTV